MKPYILTRKAIIATAADRFKAQYKSRLGTIAWDGMSYAQKFAQLDAAKTKDEINEAIGNRSWTDLWCSECGKNVASVAVFDVNGGEYEFRVCKSCCDEVWREPME